MKEKTAAWNIIEEVYEPKLTKHYEGAFAQGSGYMHIRGSFEEGLLCANQEEEYMRMPANVTIEKPRHPRSKCGMYVPGITGNHPLLKEELVNLPNSLCLFVKAEGEILDMDECHIENYKRKLSMETGVLSRRFTWCLQGEKELSCDYERYVSMVYPNLVVQSIRYEAVKGEVETTFTYDIDTKVKTNGYNHFAKVNKRMEQESCFVEMETDNGDLVRIAVKAAVGDSYFEHGTYQAYLKEGESLQIDKMILVSTSRDLEGLLTFEEMEEKLVAFLFQKIKLKMQHELMSEEMWEDSKIEIVGDEESQRAVNFSIYHLLRCGRGTDSRVAICAKGFAGEAYFGHFFWDTEMYLLPFYLYTQPKMAERLVKFRINTLEGAKKNAKLYGYAGAKYPWESSVSGEEQCPNWQYADHEVHVTADVVFGLWHYYKNTKEIQFLKDVIPVFMETAKFWQERTYLTEDGRAHINGVMGPDEYVCFCDDNAYTNYMVAYSLKVTAEALRILKKEALEAYQAIQVDELWEESLLELSKRLVIHRKEDGILLQCKDFESLEEPDFEELWTDRTRPFGQFVSQERNYRIKALKQADVLMLFYLFERDMEAESLERNYQYYLPYTTHDSSLSKIIHSILCCKRKRSEEAFSFFKEALDIDLKEEKGGAAEGIHIANCGGIYQAVVFGFAGMGFSYEHNKLTFRPMLPQGWEAIRFQVNYQGENYHIVVSKEGVLVNDRPYESRT